MSDEAKFDGNGSVRSDTSRTCKAYGCDSPVRAKGLCRHHWGKERYESKFARDGIVVRCSARKRGGRGSQCTRIVRIGMYCGAHSWIGTDRQCIGVRVDGRCQYRAQVGGMCCSIHATASNGDNGKLD